MQNDTFEDENPNSSYFRNHTTDGFEDDDQDEYYDEGDVQPRNSDAYEAMRNEKIRAL